MNYTFFLTYKNIALAVICACGTITSVANRSSSYPFIAGDTFRSISNHIVDETGMPFNPKAVQNGDIIFLKTDMAKFFFTSLHSQINARYILITHNSDLAPITLSAADHQPTSFTLEQYLDDSKLIIWFAQNVDKSHPKLKPIPIGIANGHWRHGNTTIISKMIKQIPPLKERNESVYVNCTASKHLKERLYALECLRTKPFCHCTDYKDFASYLEEISQFIFVLSPPGNGFDCHRTWEALLMGCIPIVKHSNLDPLFEGLPVILVHNWNDITEDFLREQYTKIQQNGIHTERMYADYWINYITSYQKPYKNN